jgi:beta-glucanase (GH16 family)
VRGRLRAACAGAALVVLASCSTASRPAPPAIPDNALLAPTAACSGSGSGPQPLPAGTGAGGPPSAASPWKLKFDDEFDGTALDTSVWDYRQEGLRAASYGRGHAASDRRAVSVADGYLRLRAMVDPSRSGFYLNGHVSTESSYTFEDGIASARIRFQRARGQHGAFWIQTPVSQEAGEAPSVNGAEIDVAEFFGKGYPHGGLSHFVHFRNSEGAWAKSGGLLSREAVRLPGGQRWWNSFHVFSVEWSPAGYVFRVDGRVTWCTSRGVSGVQQFLVLSLLNSDWELPALRRSTLPQTMAVDWVRVWQR